MRGIRVNAKLEGFHELKVKVGKLPDDVARGRDRGLIAGALMVQNRARELIQKGPKSGRWYKRRSIRHRASAAGEAPATDTGTLVRNVIADPQPENGSIGVYSRAAYSFFLELGTRFMAARPFLRRALMEMADRIKAIIAKYIRQEIEKRL